tara:strand:+ start:82 stop:1110 length:1029 start_codon:yes stop_codon:yes gene_type:complete
MRGGGAGGQAGGGGDGESENAELEDLAGHPGMRGVDMKLAEMILSEIVDTSPGTGFDDIAGLKFAKQSVREITVLPLLRPDVYTGARRPPKGLLLFGPPGTGKTLIAKAIATDSKSTFFNISASSLMSKWMGEGEKLVRALFGVARAKQPAVIFIDEVDSILSQRREGEQEGTIRVKNEILVQMDGVSNADATERLLLVGATNRPQELDEAARRRLQKRLLIPLPDAEARLEMVSRTLRGLANDLTEGDVASLVAATDGYSGSDMAGLGREAAYGPLRDDGFEERLLRDPHLEIRPVGRRDWENALCQVRASVSPSDLKFYDEWNAKFGSFQNQASMQKAKA